jgi:hypothetical protein
MDFDTLFKLGAITMLGGVLATVYFYVSRREVSPPQQPPSFARYFGVAAVVGIAAYFVGTAIGIYFACSSPASGNLCGIYGALGVGPLLSGLGLFLYGFSWKSQTHPTASAETLKRTTARRRNWTEHPVVRFVAGLAGVSLALYGAIALVDGEGRGAAAAVVIGIAGVYWGLMGRFPHWFRH